MWWAGIGKFAVKVFGLSVAAEGGISLILAVPVAVLILVIAYRVAGQ